MSAVEQAVELVDRTLAEHDGVLTSLATPREHTRHGGWLMSCVCGDLMGDGGDEDEVWRNYRAHVAAEIVKALGLEEEYGVSHAHGGTLGHLVTPWREVTP